MEEIKIILLSVVAGIITTFAIYLISLMIKNILIPWYLCINYKGIDISGEWAGDFIAKSGSKFNCTLLIKQNAHDISGNFNIVKKMESGNSTVSNLSIKGEVWEGFLSLSCRTISNRNLSFGSMLLKINSSELNGSVLLRNLAGDGINIESLPIIFVSKDGAN